MKYKNKINKYIYKVKLQKKKIIQGNLASVSKNLHEYVMFRCTCGKSLYNYISCSCFTARLPFCSHFLGRSDNSLFLVYFSAAKCSTRLREKLVVSVLTENTF